MKNRILTSEDIAVLMENNCTMMDIKAMSYQEIDTILESVQDYDETKVKQAEQGYSIWGDTPAQLSV